MAVPKSLRYLAGATVCIFVYVFVQLLKSPQTSLELPTRLPTLNDYEKAANFEPPPPLRRVEGDNYESANLQSARINATIMSLVRNEELKGMLQSMHDLERTWNHKFNYPWTFFNDKPFTQEFKDKTTAATNAQTRYGTHQHYDYQVYLFTDRNKKN